MFKIVKPLIDELDPMHLLAQGCPDDEYDQEIEMICTRLNYCKTPEDIAYMMNQVFINQFSTPNWFLFTGDIKFFQGAAQKVYNAMKNSDEYAN